MANTALEMHTGHALGGRYLLRGEIGRGGICVVYDAVHSVTGRPFAIKRLTEELRHRADLRARLLREAAILGALRHANVVDVVDAGDDALGAYVVLERLDGRSLEGILAARGTLSIRQSLVLVRQACAAVAAAHDAGIVHRDIKPGNMIVLARRHEDLSAAQLKVIDFGIATAPPGAAPRQKLTGEGVVLGTAEYMPLEQLTAQAEPTPSTDVWALGVTLYECLTGRVPFSGAYRDVLRGFASGRFVPLEEHRPDMPASLAAFVAQALARDPRDRFRDARAMLAALDAMVTEARARLSRPEIPAVTHERRATRAPYMTPLNVSTGRGSIEGRSEDVSADGLLALLPSSATLSVGERVQLRFALPSSGGLVSCAALVRWVRPRATALSYAVGLEFLGLEPRAERALEEYVRIVGGAEPVSGVHRSSAPR